MASVAIPGGTFDADTHTYRDEKGAYVPSITQIMSFCGFNNYNGISKDVLDNAARRGSAVHAIAWAFAKYGDVDPSWVDDETTPYFDAYKKFIAETGFVADKEWIESSIIATVHGMKFGATPDCIGTRHPWPWVVELKCCAQESKAWAIQTAAQAIARFDNQPARAKRMAVILRKDGSYRCCVHEQSQYDAHMFISALSCVHWRLQQGQRLWEVA